MLSALKADSHTFVYRGTHENRRNCESFVCFGGTHFRSESVDEAELPLADFGSGRILGAPRTGFQTVYQTVHQSVLELPKKNQAQSLTIRGHSLGAALATICRLDTRVSASRPTAHRFPIASPCVGGDAFKRPFYGNLPDCVRIVNKPDIVARLPLAIWLSCRGGNSPGITERNKD